MNKAVVLGTGFNAYSLIRAFGSAKIYVVHLSYKPSDFARRSKFVCQWHRVPSPETDGPALLKFLLYHSKIEKGAFIIGSDDASVIFLSKNREMLSKRFIPAHESWEVIGRIINKDRLYKNAKDLGVPVPMIIIPKKGDDPSQIAASMNFPCIVKPFQSTRFAGIYRKKVLVAHNPGQLNQALMDTNRHGLDVMISEIIPGEDTRLCHYRSYIDSSGCILAEMCTRKVRQHPPGFGMACAAKTIPIAPVIRDQAMKLLRGLCFRGESSAEFKLDPRDQQYKLMEINVRPVLPEEHFAAAGINFPSLAYQDLVNGIRTPCDRYELGLYWINNFHDTIGYIQSLGKKGGRVKLRQFLKPYRHRHLVCVPFGDDPKPFMAALFETFYRFGIKIWKSLHA
jgi:predicted ATP-grasp superfamily ATP-dependent carboligase